MKVVCCPYCGSKAVKKEGKRKARRVEVQKYRCLECCRYFSSKVLGHKSYPPKIILNAISTYNLGYALEQTGRELARRFHQQVPLSTIHSWVKDYANVCTFHRLRERAIDLYPPGDIVFSRRLEHQQVYEFKLHRAKLELQAGELPEQKFRLLKSYLKLVPTERFPHHIFGISDPNLEQRASQLRFETLPFVTLSKHNLANRLAELGLMLARTNRERHPCVQNFMIVNDSCTVACEVPVYLTSGGIEYFKSRGFTFDFEHYRTPITGHIDVLQIRNGLIHILDYKPEASKVNPVEQLTVYALALASRTRLALRDFKCAWFDEKNYYEFFPLHAVHAKSPNTVLSFSSRT